jgi:hypothetical protein
MFEVPNCVFFRKLPFQANCSTSTTIVAMLLFKVSSVLAGVDHNNLSKPQASKQEGKLRFYFDLKQ